jgi:ATP-binding cassette subfamily F protein 2
MEAVIWLEDYLSKWNKILLLISHSQDFLNNVCTHTIHFTSRKKLEYYDGNYDQFVKTKGELEENQMKQYAWEQDQIKSMKEYIARFGHGTSKNAKQAQSKQKVLDKMVRGGLTTKPEVEKPMNFKFPDPGHLPPPVLAFHDVSFGYPNCEPLYTNVNFGVDLDSRVALVSYEEDCIVFEATPRSSTSPTRHLLILFCINVFVSIPYSGRAQWSG